MRSMLFARVLFCLNAWLAWQVPVAAQSVLQTSALLEQTGLKSKQTDSEQCSLLQKRKSGHAPLSKGGGAGAEHPTKNGTALVSHILDRSLAQSDSSPEYQPSVTLLVPGVASLARAEQLQRTVATLREQAGIHLECIIRNYKSEVQLALSSMDVRPCELELNDGAGWFEHIRKPLKSKTDYVAIWLDSVTASTHFSIANVVQVLESNKLDALSPAVIYECDAMCQCDDETATLLRLQPDSPDGIVIQDIPIMEPQPFNRSAGIVGRRIDFVEIQVEFAKMDAFKCLQWWGDRFSSVNGWGMGNIFPFGCNASVGVYDAMPLVKCRQDALHTYDSSEALKEWGRIRRRFFQQYPEWEQPVGTVSGVLFEAPSSSHVLSTISLINVGHEDEPLTVKGGLYALALDLQLPAVVLLISLLLRAGFENSMGTFLMFFSAQLFMNIYMKEILSSVRIADGLRGIPAPFAITAIQQVVSFVLIGGGIGATRCTAFAYEPTPVRSFKGLVRVLGLSAMFACNIGLNNFSLCQLDLSVNLAIRSQAPLVTLLVEKLCGQSSCSGTSRDINMMFLFIASAGCMCMVLANAEGKASSYASEQDFSKMIIAVLVCLASLIAASLELMLASVLAVDSKVRPLDSVLYMSLPVAVMLLVPMFTVQHYVAGWSESSSLTDIEVLESMVNSHEATPFIMASLSGIFAAAYNFLLYSLASNLAPHVAALASNFNKVAAVALAVLLGMESLPPTPALKAMFVVGLLLNFGALAVVGFSTAQAKKG